jgi:DNA-binding NtrC family response regulator
MSRVLVVDDEEEVREAVRRRLEREGYQVATADSEANAIAVLKGAQPSFDVVVTDMVMESPDSGARVLMAAVSQDLFTEVIVLTAYGNVANAVECLKRGAFDYVEKNIPGVDVYDLLAIKVAQAIERRRAAVGTVRRLESLGFYGRQR